MAQRKQRCNEDNVNNMLDFVFDASYDEEMVNMDCNDYCEQLAELAEKVAHGANLEELLPEWKTHMQNWTDCAEEFEALVAVIRAENAALAADLEEAASDE